MESDEKKDKIEEIREWIIELVRRAPARDVLILERVVGGICK